MHVVFRIMGHIVVDNQRYIGHIDASCDDICRHKDVNLRITEIQHNLVTFVLIKVAMHRVRVNIQQA